MIGHCYPVTINGIRDCHSRVTNTRDGHLLQVSVNGFANAWKAAALIDANMIESAAARLERKARVGSADVGK